VVISGAKLNGAWVDDDDDPAEKLSDGFGSLEAPPLLAADPDDDMLKEGEESIGDGLDEIYER
jgi:hypothetical protein